MKKQDIKVRINNDAEAKEEKTNVIAEKGEWIVFKNKGSVTFFDHNFTLNKPYQLLRDFTENEIMVVENDEGINCGYHFPIKNKMVIEKIDINKQTVTIEVDSLDAPAFEMILKELKHARDKHPNFASCKFHAHSVLSEEVGEVARDMNDGKCFKHEASQVGAVAVRMLTELF